MQGSEEFDCQNGDSSQNQDKADDFHNKFEHVALFPLVLVHSGLLYYFSLDWLLFLLPVLLQLQLRHVGGIVGQTLPFPFLALAQNSHPFQFLLKQSHEDGISHVKLQTLPGHADSLLLWGPATSIGRLLAVHEADGGEGEGAHVPSRSPALLVVVCEGCADGDVDVEAAGGGEEEEFGRCEGVVLVELQQAEVKTLPVAALEAVQTEIKLQQFLPRNQGVGNGLVFDWSLLLHKPLQSESFDLHWAERDLYYKPFDESLK